MRETDGKPSPDAIPEGNQATPSSEDPDGGANEHSSPAQIERLLVLKEKFAERETHITELREVLAVMHKEYDALEADNSYLGDAIANLQNQTPDPNCSQPHVCSHCGSALVRRTGSRRDLAAGQPNENQANFVCEACGKESFLVEPIQHHEER